MKTRESLLALQKLPLAEKNSWSDRAKLLETAILEHKIKIEELNAESRTTPMDRMMRRSKADHALWASVMQKGGK